MNAETLALQLVRHLGDAAVRAVAIAVPMALVAMLVRRRAATQHAVWTAMLVGMLALPLWRPVAPPARVSVRSSPVALATIERITSPGPPVRFVAAAPTARPWQFYAAAVYALGFSLLGVRLLAGLWITHRVVRSAIPVPDADIWECSQVRVPLTAGYLFPRIIVPADWRRWDAATLEAVLAHEGAHVRRRDGLVTLMAAINTCVFWFHPLAWWLERRVAVLAEHAADDAALESCGDAQGYATILLAMATSLKGRGQRLVWGVGMEGGRMTERIHRVLSPGSRGSRMTRLTAGCISCGAAVLMWFGGALQLQSVARAQRSLPPVPEVMRLTPAQVAELERQRNANPDDEKITQKLLMNYRLNGREEDRARIVFWVIDHHSEWALNRHGFTSFSGDPEDEAYYQEARRRWLAQLAQHSNNAAVLGNAAWTLGARDGAVAIDYLRRAQALDPANWTEALARHYSWALLGEGAPPFSGTAELATQSRAALQASSDSVLILATVQQMVQLAGQSMLGGKRPAIDVEQVKWIAADLLNRVEQLQPGSQAMVEAREGVRLLGVDFKPQAETSTPAVLRVGGNVQAMNLLTSTPPVYPAEAQARGIQGVVKLQIRIDNTGYVDSVTLVSGDPALTDAAITAVRQYVYKPTMLNGQAYAVVTTVDVPFVLN